MDAVLGRKVLDHAVANRHLFDMNVFGAERECGTVACLAGHTMLLSGYTYRSLEGYFRPDGTFVDYEATEAMQLLSLTDDEYYGDEREPATLFGAQDEDHAIKRFRALVEAAEAHKAVS